jgi:hypothetical protein
MRGYDELTTKDRVYRIRKNRVYSIQNDRPYSTRNDGRDITYQMCFASPDSPPPLRRPLVTTCFAQPLAAIFRSGIWPTGYNLPTILK